MTKTMQKMMNKQQSKFGKSNLHRQMQVKRSKLSRCQEKCSAWASKRLNKQPIRLPHLSKGKGKSKLRRQNNYCKNKVVLLLLNDALYLIEILNYNHLFLYKFFKLSKFKCLSIIIFEMNHEDQIVVSKLKKIAVISLIFMTIEIVGGYLANSIAIMADAFHLFSDVIAYVISLYAVLLGRKLAPKYLSFGYEKAQPLGALINVMIIWAVTIELLIEATNRIISKEIVSEPLYMLLTSVFGLGCNLFIMKILHSQQGGCSHGHSNGHSHGHQHNHSQDHSHATHSHNHSDHNDHSKCKGGHNHDRQLGHSTDASHNDYEQYIQAICICSSPEQMFATKNEAESRKSSPVELGEDLVPKHKGYCVIHSNQKSNKHEEKGMHQFQNINMQAAYIHIISDIILSIGVIISASVIYFVADTKQWDAWQLADPFCTYLFSVVALYSTVSIIKQSVILLLDGCEDPNILKKSQHFLKLLKQKHVNIEIEDLKLWSTNRGKNYCAVKIHLKHMVAKSNQILDQSETLSKRTNQINIVYGKIKTFCNELKITCYIDVRN